MLLPRNLTPVNLISLGGHNLLSTEVGHRPADLGVVLPQFFSIAVCVQQQQASG
uniref:Uncharacterized protein n=1 Tax=Anguilla anguilla TaxID=7936 RepID=A0A0E9TV79_ANGAN